jgi:hypothetical protein
MRTMKTMSKTVDRATRTIPEEGPRDLGIGIMTGIMNSG